MNALNTFWDTEKDSVSREKSRGLWSNKIKKSTEATMTFVLNQLPSLGVDNEC